MKSWPASNKGDIWKQFPSCNYSTMVCRKVTVAYLEMTTAMMMHRAECDLIAAWYRFIIQVAAVPNSGGNSSGEKQVSLHFDSFWDLLQRRQTIKHIGLFEKLQCITFLLDNGLKNACHQCSLHISRPPHR